MIRSAWHVAILIPARNEEALLPRCLHSLLNVCWALPAHVTFDIVVAVDNSMDKTLSLAQSILGDYGCAFATSVRNVGKARALAAERALSRYDGPQELCWLANTDADCCIPEGWVLDQLKSAQRGVEAITGIVDVDSFTEHGPEVESRFHASYTVFADGTHPHVHGANFGVRADSYIRAGGWSSLATAEDHDLWKRLSKVVLKREANASISVITSGRKIGRAPEGFANALAAHNEVSI